MTNIYQILVTFVWLGLYYGPFQCSLLFEKKRHNTMHSMLYAHLLCTCNDLKTVNEKHNQDIGQYCAVVRAAVPLIGPVMFPALS